METSKLLLLPFICSVYFCISFFFLSFCMKRRILAHVNLLGVDGWGKIVFAFILRYIQMLYMDYIALIKKEYLKKITKLLNLMGIETNLVIFMIIVTQL